MKSVTGGSTTEKEGKKEKKSLNNPGSPQDDLIVRVLEISPVLVK